MASQHRVPGADRVLGERPSTGDVPEHHLQCIGLVLQQALDGPVRKSLQRVGTHDRLQSLGHEFLGDAATQCVQVLDLAVLDGKGPIALLQPVVQETLRSVPVGERTPDLLPLIFQFPKLHRAPAVSPLGHALKRLPPSWILACHCRFPCFTQQARFWQLLQQRRRGTQRGPSCSWNPRHVSHVQS